MRLFTEDFSGAKDDNHLVQLWLAGRPDSTKESYNATAKRFLEFLGGKSIRDAQVADLVAWVETLSGAPATITRHIGAVKSLLTYAHRTGYTVFNIGLAVRAPKVPDRLHERIVEEDVIQEILRKADNDRDRALLMVFYYSGARVTEVCSLRFKDLVGNRVTFVNTKGTKSRTVLVPPFVAAAVRALRAPSTPDSRNIFVSYRDKPICRRSAWDIVNKASDEAGCHLSPHWFRHAHATHSLDNGAPVHVVQNGLGHASLTTTTRYVHVRANQGSSQFLPAPSI